MVSTMGGLKDGGGGSHGGRWWVNVCGAHSGDGRCVQRDSGAKVEHNFILIFLKITYKLNILNCLKKIRRTFFAFGFDFKQQF